MKATASINEIERLHLSLIHQEKQECLAEATLTSDILSKLNISIEGLSGKCQQLLRQAAEAQLAMDIVQLDPIAMSIRQSREQMQKMEDEYEILKLKQKNIELQVKIDRNNKVIEGLRQELECSRQLMASQNPNPDSIQDAIRQLKVKVASYEESCEKSKANFTKLSVSDAILPTSLSALVTSLVALQEQAAELKQRADDISLAREARDTLIRLRRFPKDIERRNIMTIHCPIRKEIL